MRRVSLVVLALTLLACDGDEPALFVDLKTDYLPGRQVFGVRTLLLSPTDAEGASPLDRIDRFVSPGEPLLDGVRIAEVSGLPAGPLVVRVLLLGPTGEIVDARDTAVTFSGRQVITVLMTGSCLGVVCPSPDGDATLSTCVGGRCVDPRCSVEHPEFCGELGCADASECSSPVACGEALCIDRECFVAVRDDRCGSQELCDPRDGCVLRPDADGGPGCPATETDCVDGMDDDCDGLIDCADPDCLDAPCDDASACTQGDACRADGTCGADPIDCDDADPCTDDSCEAEFGCVRTNNTASCDDGFWCNGADTCRDGLCQDHGAPPCPAFCNEMSMACEECMVDADCGAPTTGAWGACGGFSGTCGQSGTQSRPVMTPRCMAGTCSVEASTDTQACTRDTSGVSCGTTTYTTWGSCGGYSNACDTTGTQSRTRTQRLCAGGACTSVNNGESRACSRTVANGTSCGSGSACCSGACVSITSSTRCGGCNVNCSSIGRTCASTGTGGYSCRGCTTNAECRTILNSAATCYDVTAPPAYCECQCAANGVCANGGCGAGFYCHDCPGHNFCSNSGGSC
ncbi:MAG: hypothetical protein H6719_11165 [Sandaracinaceae bacterium]|nr:hypothetical protein [Sandaracinaceae bacterium]